MVESLSGFLDLLGVQCLPQSLLGQVGIEFHPHPGLAVLEQELLLVRPEVNWRGEENKEGHQSRERKASELIRHTWFTTGILTEDGLQLGSKKILKLG